MANQKATALTGFTPILTDIIYAVDDPGGTPISGKVTFQQAMDLMEANMTVPASVSSAYLTSTILASTTSTEGAALIGVEDSGTFFAGANVEAVLAEIGALLPAEANADVTDETNVLAALSGATLTEVDPAATDKILVLDASDSFNIKNLTWSDVTAAAGGGSPEGTSVLSTGEVGGSKFLREDGDGTSSWQTVTAAGVSIADAGGLITATTVEGALAENRTAIDAIEAVYVSSSDIGVSVQAYDANLPTWPATVDATEVGYLNGVTSAIQTQLDAKVGWSTAINSSLTVDTDSTYDIGTTTTRVANAFVDQAYASAVVFSEAAANPVAAAEGLGQLWVSNDATQKLMFTDDADTDKEVAFVTGGTDLSAYTGVLGLNSGTAVDITSQTLLEARIGSIAIEGTAILSTGEAGGSKYLREDGDGTCSWQTVAGGGDVSKVGTPVDGQIGVWTGDGTIEGDAALTFDTTDDTLVIAASGKLGFGAVDILSDSAGTTTLQNIDALDATTEATIEAAIDTLANLTSIQGNTVTLTGDFIRSGAHSLTLTTGGATNVTLPTTGTLAAYGDATANFTGTLQNGGSNVVVDTDIGSTVQAYDADTLKADTADQLTAGFTAATDDDSTAASPYTPDHDTGNYKRVINDGAMTINGPTMASGESTSMVILLTNTTGAGAITFGTTTDSGDTIGTTTTDEYLIFITAVDVGGTTYSHASVKALQ